MSAANIVINQSGLPAGVASQSRDDLVLNTVVQLSNSNDAGVRSWRWALKGRPRGSTAVLSNPNSPNPTFIPDRDGTYRVQLVVDQGLSGQRDSRVGIIRDLEGFRIPAVGEGAEANYPLADGTLNTEGFWPDISDLLDQARVAGTWVNVREYGAQGDGVTDDTDALQAALDAGGVTFMPPGTYLTTSPLRFYSNTTLVGGGTQISLISYQGTDWALITSTTETRTYNQRFDSFQISLGASAVGGINMRSCSVAYASKLAIFGTGSGGGAVGVHMSGPISGYAVYNRFDNVRCLSLDTGFEVHGLGSNDTHIVDSRAGNCVIGVSIIDSNHVVIDTSAIEGCTTGVRVEATSNALSDAATVYKTRFEGCTTNIEYAGTASFIRHPVRSGNHHVTGTPVSGTPTSLREMDVDTVRGLGIACGVADTPFRLERSVQGGANLPALLVLDSSAAGGTPNTVQAAAGRHAGHVFSGGFWNAGTYTENFAVTADGDATMASLTCEDITLGNDLQLDPASLILLGDGVTTGSPGLSIQRPTGSNTIWWQARTGTAATGLKWSEQFTTSNNVDGISYDASGVAHAIRPYRKVYSTFNGITGMAFNRLWGNLATAITSSAFTASTGLGTGATVVPDADSRDMRGEVTITIGTTPSANPTVVLVYAAGTWPAAPFCQAHLIGGTGVAAGTITRITQARSTSRFTWTLPGTPLAGETYIISWMAMG